MSSAMSTHVKLGLLTLAGLLGVSAAVFALGLYGSHATTITYHTYFDESVQGLELGAPVKYRGVRIGNASTIEIAPDRKRVDVGLALLEREVTRLGLAAADPALRAQLATQGITGVKFIELDFCDPATSPPPRLPFPAAARYLPARSSMIKGLLDNLEAVGQKLPELADRTSATLAKLGRALDELTDEHVVRQVADAVAGIGRTSAELGGLVRNLDRARLGERTAGTLGKLDGALGKLDSAVGKLDGALTKLDGALERLGGDAGLLASARRATDAFGDLGVGAAGSAGELDRTLREVGEAALAIRELAEAVERDPDMLVKGRARQAP